MSTSTITHINSLAQLDTILSKSSTKVSVIDFHATWCGPCHAIAPTFEALSKKYSNVNFLKCDVDAARDVAGKYKVSAMPTFVFLKGSTQVGTVRGANPAGLESELSKHASPSSSSSSTSAFTGKGHRLGGDSDSPTAAARETARAAADKINIDPQLKLLLGLLGAYFVFWWMSSD